MQHQRLRARCCSLLLPVAAAWVTACALCALCARWMAVMRRVAIDATGPVVQCVRRRPVCVCLWCGITPHSPEYNYFVAAATSSTAEQRLQQRSTMHTVPSTMLKLHPASPPPHMAACLGRPLRGLRVDKESPNKWAVRLDR